jgi:hypothetical protein
MARSSKRQPVENQFRIYTRIWKMVGQVARWRKTLLSFPTDPAV